MANRILAIIVTYNAKSWLDYCIGSLLESEKVPDIICVDNSSTDETVQLIAEKYPAVELIRSKSNMGFGKGNNIGLRKCIDEGYDYAFLLNQDARVEPDTIQKLVSAHIDNSDYGVLSPIHRAYQNNMLDDVFTKYLRADNTPNYMADVVLNEDLKQVYPTRFVNAALWLISKECLLRVGEFDPHFTHYCEDDDYLDRVHASGLKVGIVPAALANHARDKFEAVVTTDDRNHLRSSMNRAYVILLLRYKRFKAKDRTKFLFFLREMLSELVRHTLMLDPHKFRKTIIIYSRLFKAVRNKDSPH